MPKKNFCVIVPAFNEEKVIEQSLNSLKKFVSKKQIFVVSDGSTDKTVKLAKQAQVNTMGLTKNVGKAKAILKLLKSRKIFDTFKYVLLSDADSQLSKDFAKQLRFALKTKPACIVGTVKSDRRGIISAYRTYEYGFSHLIFKNAQNVINTIAVAPGCASIYRSDVLKKLNFENETLTEDFDLTLQIHQQKLGRVVYASKALVTTQDPRTLKDYWRQVLRWNTGFWQNVFIHRLLLPTKKINLEIIVLTSDGIFSLACLVYFLKKPLIFINMVGAMLIFIVIFSILILLVLRQFWAILYTPFFPLFYFINLASYIAGFFRAIIGRKRTLSWGKVARYQARA